MEPMKFNKSDHPPYQNQSKPIQVPSQHSNLQFNSYWHFPRQNDAPVSKNYPNMPLPPVSSKPPIGANGYTSGAPSSQPTVVGNMPFQNSNYHFQPYPPTLVPHVSTSTSLHSSVSLTQNNHRPVFNMPPPSAIPAGNVDPMQFGRFNFPLPPIAAPPPYFHQGYIKNESSFHNNYSQEYCNNTSMQTGFPGVSNQPSTMSQIISNIESTSTVPENKTSEKEDLLNNFLQKFNIKEKHVAKSDITVVEFRSGLKKCFSLFNLLQSSRENLVSLLDSNQKQWERGLQRVIKLQNTLSEACSMFLVPNNLTTIKKKLKAVKRKRALKKKLRATVLEQKTKKEQERERLHQEIDKWFDNLKEKNEKMKREIEMKKEADNILAEVRRKIHEAKKTIEKLKVFEKLRTARQASAVQKGLHLQPEHSAKFEAKISHLRETMLSQLSNYEQEEKALQVMLETEQGDRLEEEALWRKRKLMTFQQKKQKAILQSLFGNSEEPASDDDLYLFYQYQNSGNKSIDNLVKIRHHWDIHLSGEGESIPLQWVVPVPPSRSSWVEYCTS